MKTWHPKSETDVIRNMLRFRTMGARSRCFVNGSVRPENPRPLGGVRAFGLCYWFQVSGFRFQVPQALEQIRTGRVRVQALACPAGRAPRHPDSLKAGPELTGLSWGA